MRYYSSKKVKFKIKLSCFCGLEFKETKGQNSSSPTSYSALSQLEGISMPGESLRSFSNRSLSCSSWNGGRFRRSSKLENNNTSKSVTYFFFFFCSGVYSFSRTCKMILALALHPPYLENKPIPSRYSNQNAYSELVLWVANSTLGGQRLF